MSFSLLDTVVLDRDLPEHNLRKGDLGAIVELYSPKGLEVEFVTAGGATRALVSLTEDDVRALGRADVIAVRQVDIAAIG